MKNILSMIFAVVIAILLGTFLIKVSDKEPTLETISISQLKAFQLGAYETEYSANKNKRENTIVVKEGNMYCIYAAILSEKANIERMINYLNNKNTYYYIKDISANTSFYEELYKYEMMMKETTSDVAFTELNNKILELFRSNV